MIFSVLTESVVLFSVPAVFWHLMIVRGLGGASVGRIVITGAITLAVTVLAFVVVRFGVFGTPLGQFPGAPLLTIAIAVTLALTLGPRLLGNGVPQQLLLAVQLFRPIGMIFVLEDVRGTLPSSFAQPAGWGDFLAGLVTAAVLLRYPTGRVPPRAVVLVAVVGIANFASAFFFGFTSSATPFQLFAFNNPNRVLEYPLGFIPVLLVPYAIFSHLLSILQLRSDSSGCSRLQPVSRTRP